MSEELKALLDYLDAPQSPYVWDVVDAPIVGSEEGLMLQEMSELGDRSIRFFNGLGDLFPANSYVEKLQDYFGTRIPTAQLQDIVSVCQEKLGLDIPHLERLRLGLDELLPQWSPEDLSLLTRNYGVAFRGGSKVLATSLGRDWDGLSTLGQAQYVA
ncbi:MAG: hypothetical protein HC799_10880, partial [Limnothrix sp. RL_2_0]|nr:hypothetical protein [Limnothrix sp. RL_2_0]